MQSSTIANDQRIRIELDTCIDPDGSGETFESFATNVSQCGLEVELVQEIGPGGGNPLVAYIGTKADVVSYLQAYYDEPVVLNTTIDEWLESATIV